MFRYVNLLSITIYGYSIMYHTGNLSFQDLLEEYCKCLIFSVVYLLLIFFSAFWGEWGSYGYCTATCGYSGEKSRKRTCYFDGEADDRQCDGPAIQVVSCNRRPCRKIYRSLSLKLIVIVYYIRHSYILVYRWLKVCHKIRN